MASDSLSSFEKAARKLLDQLTGQTGKYTYSYEDAKKGTATQEILDADPETQVAFIRGCVDRVASLRTKLGKPRHADPRYMNLSHENDYPRAGSQVAIRLLRRKLPLQDDDITFLVSRTADLEMTSRFAVWHLEPLVGVVERHVLAHGLSAAAETALRRLHTTLDWITNAPERKLQRRIRALLAGPRELSIEPGEAWSDAALRDLDRMLAKQKSAWAALLQHCQAATGSKPAEQWLQATQTALKAVGKERFKKCVLSWFPLVDKPRTQAIENWPHGVPNPNLMIIDAHTQILKGLVWCCGLREDKEIARALASLAASTYKKVPKIGPRAVKVGNACVYALGTMPGTAAVGQLALLKVKIKFGTAQKEIGKAFGTAAQRAGLPAEELEEMGVPAYGLSDVGRLAKAVGDFTAVLTVIGTHSTKLIWLGPGGKPQKSVPAAVKEDHAGELKELSVAAKDIEKMLPAQRDRIDNLFLSRKSWPYGIWRERYLDHPLVGTLARRIIWRFRTGKKGSAGIYHDGQLVDQDDLPLRDLSGDTDVELWHPIACEVNEVLAWRKWLEGHCVQQPFKQAHREVYMLTDAERTSRVYSNRFAAHVVRQHQFNALCAVRGWKNKLRLMVDDEYPPATLLLPQWNLRAEFWTEGAGTEYGVDTNDTGTYRYLATDQVRFYAVAAAQRVAHAYGGGYAHRYGQANAAPVPLEDIPRLVFSEVMRDVDLFVGVASVGNDPNWSDGGPQGRYRDYWQSYSFGDLSATAQTRKETLQHLVPRLKIAERCTFADRFLVVRGELHTYKIHLGSGNVLMSPNDQILRIVPKPLGASKEGGKIFLPFDGDNMLSIVLSKAFLLAEDAEIKDVTILEQIGRYSKADEQRAQV